MHLSLPAVLADQRHERARAAVLGVDAALSADDSDELLNFGLVPDGDDKPTADLKLVDERLGVLHRSYFELIGSRPGFFRNFLRNSYLGCCMAFKRELLDVALPLPGGVAHDYWIGMVGELFGHPAFVPRPLLLYRRHLRAASSAGFKSRRSLRARVATRWTLATELVKRLPKIMNSRPGR